MYANFYQTKRRHTPKFSCFHTNQRKAPRHESLCGKGDIAPSILNVYIRLSITFRSLHHQRMSHWYPLNRKLVGPRKGYGRARGDKKKSYTWGKSNHDSSAGQRRKHPTVPAVPTVRFSLHSQECNMRGNVFWTGYSAGPRRCFLILLMELKRQGWCSLMECDNTTGLKGKNTARDNTQPAEQSAFTLLL